MRFDITQLISHRSKTLLGVRAPKIRRADEAQEHDAERDAKSCDQYQVVAKYQRQKRRPKPERSTAILELIAGGLPRPMARGHIGPDHLARQKSRQISTPVWCNRGVAKLAPEGSSRHGTGLPEAGVGQVSERLDRDPAVLW